MNEKLFRPQFDTLKLADKLWLMQTLATRYHLTFKELYAFSRWGQSCTTGLFEKGGREFVFVPGDTVILGWESFVQGMDKANQEELADIFAEIEYEGSAEEFLRQQFTKKQMEHFSQLQREKAKKPVQLDEQAASECRNVLSAFFAEMTEWEQYMDQVGFEDAEAVPRLLAIWEKYVSEKPRLGYRPLALSYSAQGTYNGEEFLDAEQITKNKLYIYTREKNTSFDRRFLMKRVGEGWMIDAVQERLDGWQRTGL